MIQRDDSGLGPLPEGTQATIPTLLLTYQQVALHLGVSEREVRRMVAADTLPVVEIGRLRRIAYDDLRAWVKRQRRFYSYFITPETFKLTKRLEDDERLKSEFSWG